MAPVARLTPLLAHGGVGGVIVESVVVIAIAALFAAIYLRERRARRSRRDHEV